MRTKEEIRRAMGRARVGFINAENAVEKDRSYGEWFALKWVLNEEE